ncbi:MAG: type I-E CRISPR-associated protein Cas5/CasD [Oscillospiraceae bacterium]|jgi:CRISPR system Cascade subunit CasD|nr:type I-E CRISPR-associated protein Cas5/CasD [Oscillospiraceae bacterium]
MTLLIRLAAPLQSWGDDSKFNTRRTAREPTKSGVIGLCACALGRRRTQSIADLAALIYGVRTDKAGKLLTDYQTARKPNSSNPFISTRHYLCDAQFTAGLEGDAGLLAEIDAALRSPVFPLFLGRRSCPPTLPLSLGAVDKPLAEALCDGFSGTVVLDAVAAGALRRRDFPQSFSQKRREHAFRGIEVREVRDVHNENQY